MNIKRGNKMQYYQYVVVITGFDKVQEDPSSNVHPAMKFIESPWISVLHSV